MRMTRQQDKPKQFSPVSSARTEFHGKIFRKVRIRPGARWDFELDVWSESRQLQCVIDSSRLPQEFANQLFRLVNGLWVAGVGRHERRGLIAIEKLLVGRQAGIAYEIDQMVLAFDYPYF